MAKDRLLHVPFTASGDGSGKQTISLPTGAGTPVGVLFWVVATDADDASDNHDRISCGASDGTRSRVLTGFSQETASTIQSARFGNSTHVIHIRDMAGGNDDFARMDTTPFGVDAINIEWNGGTDPGFSYKGMAIVAVGDNAHCEVDDHTSAAAIDTDASTGYTDMTVAPELLFVFSGYDVDFSGAAEADDFLFSIGWCADNSGSFDQVTRGRNVEDNRGAGPRIASYTSAAATPRVTGAGTHAAVDLGRLEVNRMDTNAGKGRHTVRLKDVDLVAVDYAFMAVSFEGHVEYEVDVWQQDMTSSGNKSILGAPFAPNFFLGVQHNANSADEGATLNINRMSSLGLGAIDAEDSTGDAYTGWTDRLGTNPANSGSYYASRIFAPRDDSGGLAYGMDFVSFDSGGVTFNMPVGETVAATKSIPYLLTSTRIDFVEDETENIEEGTEYIRGRLSAQTETEEIGEGTIASRGRLAIETETEQIGEGTVPARGRLAIVDEEERVAEDTLALLGLLRELTESENIQEGVEQVLGLIREITETEQIGEGVESILGIVRDATETEQVQEGVERLLGFVRLATEIENIQEGTLAILTEIEAVLARGVGQSSAAYILGESVTSRAEGQSSVAYILGESSASRN